MSTVSNPLKVLIGIDGSEDADEAFKFYAEHLHIPEHEALLVYVVRPLVISSNEMAIYVNEIKERSIADEKIKVKQLKDIYEEKMRTCEIRGKINIIYYSKKPGKILCEMAEEEKCCAIVIGCRRNGKGSLGSTADYVFRKSPCAISLVRMPSLTTEASESTSKLEEYQGRRFSKDRRGSSPRFRRISCPVVSTPPTYLDVEQIGRVAGAVGGGLGIATGGLKAPQKQRRHSSVVNVFQQLSLQTPTRKKLPSHSEEKEEAKKC